MAEGANSHSPYNSMWNNPVAFSDPEGDFAWIPFAIGAALGGFSGHSIGKANGATGWGMVGYIAGGAAIGGLSGAAGAGVTSSLGTSLSTQYGGLIATAAGGATGGAIAGGGFAGLAGQNVLDGTWKGALSGFVGAGLGGYISGGAGAFVGGAASGGINAGLNGENVGLSALAGGALSFGSYQLTSAINYKKFSKAGGTLSRKQFNAFSRASQKSFTRGREFGGWLTTDGDVQWWNKGAGASVSPTPKPSNAFGEFHTHPNQGGGWIEWHSPGDIRGSNADGTFSYVIGRRNYYTYRPGALGPLLGGANSYFSPYPYNYYWWKFLSPMGIPPGN